MLGLALTPEAKSCNFWRTSLGKFRLLSPSGQREEGGGFLDEGSEEVVTDTPSPECYLTLGTPAFPLISLATPVLQSSKGLVVVVMGGVGWLAA